MATKLLWATGPLSMSHICAFDHWKQIYFNAGIMDLIPVAFHSKWKGYVGTTVFLLAECFEELCAQ